MTTRPLSRISSTLSPSCTGMRTAGSSASGIGGGGGGSGKLSTLSCAAAPSAAHTRRTAAAARMRHLPALAGLHERQRFEQFVERAVAAGQDDVGAREFREHHLAREEMLEAQA